jgi:hypothetical protein
MDGISHEMMTRGTHTIPSPPSHRAHSLSSHYHGALCLLRWAGLTASQALKTFLPISEELLNWVFRSLQRLPMNICGRRRIWESLDHPQAFKIYTGGNRVIVRAPCIRPDFP